MIFGLGNVRKHEETIEMQEELIDELYTQLANMAGELASAKSRTPKTRRKRLASKTGFHRVSESESLEMYEMYMNDCVLSDIANKLGRSQSTVTGHIRKHMEQEDA